MDAPHFDYAKFLVQLGYIAAKTLESEDDHEEQLTNAIATAQKFYGLPQTGRIDNTTARILQRTHRCGCKDVEAETLGQVVNRWAITDLTYCVLDAPPGIGLTLAEVEQVVARSFAKWSGVCGLTFREVADAASANIVLRCDRGRLAGFDGPSGILAFAQLPQGEYSGQLQLVWDADEAFTTDPGTNGILIELVTDHEIGHLCGLTHTSTPGQLMLPTYSPLVNGPQSEDRSRVQQLYGPPKSTPAAAAAVEVQVRVGGVDVYTGTLPKRWRMQLAIAVKVFSSSPRCWLMQRGIESPRLLRADNRADAAIEAARQVGGFIQLAEPLEQMQPVAADTPSIRPPRRRGGRPPNLVGQMLMAGCGSRDISQVLGSA